jgi:hypothetical protein
MIKRFCDICGLDTRGASGIYFEYEKVLFRIAPENSAVSDPRDFGKDIDVCSPCMNDAVKFIKAAK